MDSCRSALASLAVSPQAKPGSHVLGFRGSLFAFDCQAWPLLNYLESQSTWSVWRVRAWSPARGEGEAGEGPESLSTSSHDASTKNAMQALRQHRPGRSEKAAPGPHRTGRFDQPCGKTVPSGNLGPMQRGRGTAPQLAGDSCEMMLPLLCWARPSASSLIFP